MLTRPPSLAYLLGTSNLWDLLRDATKATEIGLDWIPYGVLEWLEDDCQEIVVPGPPARALELLCRAELDYREGKSETPPVFKIDVQVPLEHQAFVVDFCCSRVLFWRKNPWRMAPDSYGPAALFWYIAACQFLEQMRAARTPKH